MTKLLSNIDKIKSDFKNGQSYNSEHINLGIFFKASLAIFWVLFWLLEVQQHLYWANVHWIFPDYDTKGCPANMSVFWADFCIGLLFIIELIIAHALFFAAILYVDFFSIQKRYGFLKVGKTAFFIRYLLIVPLIDIVRNAVFLLIAMLVFNYGIKLPLAAFIIIVIVVTTLVVLADVKFSGQVQSITRGKMTPLSELDQELEEMVQKEWAERAPGRKKLACFVMEGESGHSNCFVDNERLVIFDSMFEHVRERHHMMSIIRHEMGHELFKHVAWIVLYRVIYYDVILVGFIFLVKYKQDWLAQFAIKYNSLFLCLFIASHFLHFKILQYLQTTWEHAEQRRFEFQCDDFAARGSEQDRKTFREGMLIIFQKNQSDFHSDPLYSLVKNSHPTLQERLAALQS